MKRRVLFNKASAVFWLLLGIASFPLGWSSNVVMVWIASVYANVKTDWGTAEAADDTVLIKRLDELQYQVNRIEEQQAELLRLLSNRGLTSLDNT
jgi:hypothetical protein